MAQWRSDEEKKEIVSVIFGFFEAGKNKDLPALGSFHLSGDSFTKFDEDPPHARQSSEEAFVYEQAAFANISDYTYQIDELRIDSSATQLCAPSISRTRECPSTITRSKGPPSARGPV